MVGIGLGALDLLALSAAFFSAYYVRFWSPLFTTYKYVPVDYYLMAWPVVALVVLCSYIFLGLYDTRKPASGLQLFLECLKGATLGTIVLLMLSFWVRSFTYSRWVVLLSWFFFVVLDWAVRVSYQRFVEDLRRKGFDHTSLLVIGSGVQARHLLETLKAHPELGYRVIGFLNGPAGKGEEVEGYPVLGCLDDLVDILHEQNIEEVAVADDQLDAHKEFLLVQPCRAEGVRIRVVPSLYDFALSVRGLRVIDHLFWYTLEPTVTQRWYIFMKRMIDILVSLLLLLPTALIFPFLALAIKLDSRGPVIFSQPRTGTNGKPFRMYKFRSMVPEAESILPDIVDVSQLQRPAFKMENDPRVTRIGRYLRRFSLDELPQFFNVLKGEMSLVGPRPEELWIAKKYDARERARLQIKPGITGFQQIRCRGSEDFDDRLRHDLYYLNNQSLLLDLSIMLETLWVVIKGKGRH